MNDIDAKGSDEDIQLARAPSIVRAGGGVVLGAGVLAMLVSVQTITGFHVGGAIKVALVLLALLGLATAVSGLMTMKARSWAAWIALACSAVLFLATSAWLLVSLSGGFISLFALGAPPLSLMALAFAALSIAPSRRASAARARLTALGSTWAFDQSRTAGNIPFDWLPEHSINPARRAGSWARRGGPIEHRNESTNVSGVATVLPLGRQ